MKLLKANALLFQCHYPIAMTIPVGYVRFEGEAPTCVSFPFLPVGRYHRGLSASRPPPPRSLSFPSRSSIRTQAHAYANLFCRCISERDARGCVARTRVSAYTCIVLVRWHIARRAYACMLRRAVVQANRGGEGHKLNDVNALSTLCRCERRRHTGLPSRVRRPPWLVAAATTARTTNSDGPRLFPLACLDAGPLPTDYNYRDLHSGLVRTRRMKRSEKTSVRYIIFAKRARSSSRDRRQRKSLRADNFVSFCPRGCLKTGVVYESPIRP